ncbi:hypothetical protein [Shinella zoogloeoides]|uniref:hypothetical protein n=1 Tax=Shinella zoogloeoides TaxID=352475 RepID=UPI00273FCA1D|nr:hypothetical protein [Shinella zoogloeoides]WLR92198.1 hypothetical protein Q9316_17285 [Shinella zoogloeoides]
MRHDNLVPLDLESLFGRDRPTLSSLPDWYALGGHCSNCEREGWINRWELQREVGGDVYLYELRPWLRCLKCGNKGSNTWITAKLPR